MNVIEKLTGIFKADPATRDGVQLIRDRKKVWQELKRAHENQTVVGVISQVMGEGMFLVAVESMSDDDQVINFCPYDLSGKLLTWSTLDLSEIKMICPFATRYKNPVLH